MQGENNDGINDVNNESRNGEPDPTDRQQASDDNNMLTHNIHAGSVLNSGSASQTSLREEGDLGDGQQASEDLPSHETKEENGQTSFHDHVGDKLDLSHNDNEPITENRMSPTKTTIVEESAVGGSCYEEFGLTPLTDELDDMLRLSTVAYGFADMRRLAKKGMICEEMANLTLTLPVPAKKICTLMMEHPEEVLKMNNGDQVACDSTLAYLTESMKRNFLEGAEISVFDDENSNSELVYGIGTNSNKKRITVFFRGSVTVKDWKIDANDRFHDMPYTVKSRNGSILSETIGVHSGFHKYLLGKTGKSKQNKFNVIMSELESLLKKHPGFSIYTTGHSLGGALSTLFAFKASAEAFIPKPVSCINIASPKVGDINFRRAFKSLERRNQVRCLRVANDKDIITQLPQRGRGSCIVVVGRKNCKYRHVGVKLLLHNIQKFEISYSKDELSLEKFIQECRKYVTKTYGALSCGCQTLYDNHSMAEYRMRLHGVFIDLNDIFLNDHYSDINFLRSD